MRKRIYMTLLIGITGTIIYFLLFTPYQRVKRSYYTHEEGMRQIVNLYQNSLQEHKFFMSITPKGEISINDGVKVIEANSAKDLDNLGNSLIKNSSQLAVLLKKNHVSEIRYDKESGRINRISLRVEKIFYYTYWIVFCLEDDCSKYYTDYNVKKIEDKVLFWKVFL